MQIRKAHKEFSKHRYRHSLAVHSKHRGEVAHVPKVARLKEVVAPKAKDDEDDEVSPSTAEGHSKRHSAARGHVKRH